MTQRHYLITGGTGFIGRALVDRLDACDERATVLTRDARAARALLPAGMAAIEDLDELEEMSSPDVVVNLAGENLGNGRWNERRKREFIDSRVRTTERVLAYVREAEIKPRVMISGSAVGYYGARGDEPIAEDEPAGDEYQSRLCVAWEDAARPVEDHGVRLCRIRLGAVLGREGGALSSMLPPFRMGLGGRQGSGDQWVPWVHRADVIEAIRFLVDRDDLAGAFNLTAPNPVRNRELAETLAKVLGRPAFMHMPESVVRLMFGEMARLFLTGQRVVPNKLQEAGFEFRFTDLESALRDILNK